MATAKLATLIIRTLAKPIAARIKTQAQSHDSFKNVCISLAQWSHRSEVRLRTGLLGENPKNIRPLSEARAIQNGADNLAEGFLFAVAAAIILGETYRGARKDANRRDAVDVSISDLSTKIEALDRKFDSVTTRLEEKFAEQVERNSELERILSRVVHIGLHGGLEEVFTTGSLKVPVGSGPEEPTSGATSSMAPASASAPAPAPTPRSGTENRSVSSSESR